VVDDATIGAGAERRFNKRMRKRDEMEAGHRSFQLDPTEKTVDSQDQGANALAAADGPVYGPANKPMPLAPLLVSNLNCTPEWLCEHLSGCVARLLSTTTSVVPNES
jgi:hypothetical protein